MRYTSQDRIDGTGESGPSPLGGRALVVEDEPGDRLLLAAALQRAGFDVIEADDGEEGLRLFQQQAPELVLLDILMPGIDGFDVCRRIRALPTGARVPVIMTTALDDEESIVAAYAAGATDFVTKPINLKVLMHRSRYIWRAHQVLGNLDALTGLPGRAALGDWVAGRAGVPRRQGRMTAVFYLALDRFRIINDTLGRSVGDELLLLVVERLRSSLRGRDDVRPLAADSAAGPGLQAGEGALLARAGGDEFVVWLEGMVSEADAKAVAARLLDAIRAPFWIRGEALHLTASLGMALGGSPETAPLQLVERAEAAMDEAKRSGRDASRQYEAAMNESSRRIFSLEKVMRRALDTNCFEMYLQPKVDLRTGRTHGMEALMRLDYPGYGSIPPSDFIPVAEQTGLIVALDRWALLESCRLAQRCARSGLDDLTVAVNVSAALFNEVGFPGYIAEVLHETRLDPGRLEVELTERVLLEDTDASLTTLEALRALGVGIAVDDFGTGYSSLSYLRRFKATGLKIDRSFIQDITVDPGDAAIVDVIVSLGRKLDMVVTAEGVETPGQADFLRDLGCHEAQGWLFSPALPVAEFITWVRENRVPASVAARSRPLQSLASASAAPE